MTHIGHTKNSILCKILYSYEKSTLFRCFSLTIIICNNVQKVLAKNERIYRQAFYDAAKKADPDWKIGKPIKAGALDDVTRASAEKGKFPAQATLDTKI